MKQDITEKDITIELREIFKVEHVLEWISGVIRESDTDFRAVMDDVNDDPCYLMIAPKPLREAWDELEDMVELAHGVGLTEKEYHKFLQDWNELLWQLRDYAQPYRDGLYRMLSIVAETRK